MAIEYDEKDTEALKQDYILPDSSTTFDKFFSEQNGSLNLYGGQMQSPNYAAGESGWALFPDGSAEFQSVRAALSQVIKKYVCGDDITLGQAVFICNGTQQFQKYDKASVNTNTEEFGNTTNRQKFATLVTMSSTITVDRVKVTLQNLGTPTDSAVISIQANVGGVPSGTDLCTGSIAAASITGSAEYNIQMNQKVTLTSGVQYWIVLSRSGTLSATNRYGVGVKLSGGSDKVYNGSAWAVLGTDTEIKLILTPASGEIAPSNSATAGYFETFVGFATKNSLRTSQCPVIIAGELTGKTGLTVGHYYLSDSSGAIGTSPGTNTRKIGIATSSTTLLITNIW